MTTDLVTLPRADVQANLDALCTAYNESTRPATSKLLSDAIMNVRAHLAAPTAEPQAVQAIFAMLENMTRPMIGVEQAQPGWHHRSGWNDALRQIGDYVRGGALGDAAPAPQAAQGVPEVLRTAVEDALEAFYEIRSYDDQHRDYANQMSERMCAAIAASSPPHAQGVPAEVAAALNAYNENPEHTLAHAFVMIVEDWLQILAASPTECNEKPAPAMPEDGRDLKTILSDGAYIKSLEALVAMKDEQLAAFRELAVSQPAMVVEPATEAYVAVLPNGRKVFIHPDNAKQLHAYRENNCVIYEIGRIVPEVPRKPMTPEQVKMLLARGGIRYSSLKSCDEIAAIAFVADVEKFHGITDTGSGEK